MQRKGASKAVHEQVEGGARLPEALEPCLGVMCSVHGVCAKYQAINGTRIPSDRWRAFCGTDDAYRPGFVSHVSLPWPIAVHDPEAPKK